MATELKESQRKIIAVDFDDTLFMTTYPKIDVPNPRMIQLCRHWKRKGHCLILWTCREGKELMEAVEICADYGIEFDAVNDNLESGKKKWKNNPRKIYADYYIDDKAVNANNIENLEKIDFGVDILSD